MSTPARTDGKTTAISLDHVQVAAPPALDELARRLTAAGARVDWDHELPDVRRFYTEDPWGNRIELLAPAA